MNFFKPISWHKENAVLREQADNELHQRLINNFVKNNRSRDAEIEQAIKDGDIKSAHRMAHSLKNNAAQLKKSALNKAAAEIERLLADGENLITRQHMDALGSELRIVIKELESLVYETDKNNDAEPIEAAAAYELLEKIEPLVENFNTDCLTFAYELRAVSGSGELITNMQNLDFELAGKSLAALKKEIMSHM
jgi:HPt (histidine-containing phosphotransfer) domain-containing protein